MTFLPLLAAPAGALLIPANLAFGLGALNPPLLQRHAFRAQTFNLCIWHSGKGYVAQMGTAQLSIFVVFKFDETPNRLVVRQHDNTGVFDRAFHISGRVGDQTN